MKMDKKYNNIKIKITRYFIGEASPEEKDLIKSWISESKENYIEFCSLRNIWEVANPTFDPATINSLSAYKKVTKNIKSKQTIPLRKILYYWQRAAAILILPLLILTVYFILADPSLLTEETTAYNEIRVPAGTSAKVTLPDSSVVWLNGGSSLTYPLNFTSSKREVKLNGEAFFDVISNPNNPFTVVAPDFRVVAIGTAFNVEAYNKSDIRAVTLSTGIINIEINTGQVIKLKPNERLVLNKFTNQYSVNHSDAEKWSSWKDGIMMFRDDELGYIFNRLNLIYSVDIQITDEYISRYLYRATFKDESLNEILDLIKLSAPIEYKDYGRQVKEDGTVARRTIKVYLK